MQIQVVAYSHRMRSKTRTEVTAQIINDSEADLILFPGSTLTSYSDIAKLQALIRNKKTQAIIELKDDYQEYWHGVFLLNKGKLKFLETGQIFAQSSVATRQRVFDLLDEVQTKRSFDIVGQRCILLQCGENNIIHTPKANNYEPHFRYEHDDELYKVFKKIIKSTKVILNPMHTQQQQHFSARSKYLSRGCYYFGTANTEKEGRRYTTLDSNIITALYKGYPLNPICISERNDRYKWALYQIK